jgi:hypothetical protein
LAAGRLDWFKMEWLPPWFTEIFLKSNGGNLAVSSRTRCRTLGRVSNPIFLAVFVRPARN